jgi:hypothetical protein
LKSTRKGVFAWVDLLLIMFFASMAMFILEAFVSKKGGGVPMKQKLLSVSSGPDISGKSMSLGDQT